MYGARVKSPHCCERFKCHAQPNSEVHGPCLTMLLRVCLIGALLMRVRERRTNYFVGVVFCSLSLSLFLLPVRWRGWRARGYPPSPSVVPTRGMPTLRQRLCGATTPSCECCCRQRQHQHQHQHQNCVSIILITSFSLNEKQITTIIHGGRCCY